LGGKERKREKIGNEGKKRKEGEKGYRVLPTPHTPHFSQTEERT
jgi:hypothetical protein